MSLRTVSIGGFEVSRLAIGGNPFSGFSHQGPDRDRQMRRYYTAGRIKEALARAEAAGINTFFGRADNHIMRLLEEYWDEGGSIQWFAQTASERPDYLRNIAAAAAGGAKGCYLHGGQTDFYWRRGEVEHFARAAEAIRAPGMAAGLAGHNPEPHEWIRDHLEADFQLCCYYDPAPRVDRPDHVPSDAEKFDPAHRDRMAETIRTLKCPAVHYKVLAAGRTPAREAFEYVAGVLRPQDVVLVGFFLGDDPEMIAKTAALFEEVVEAPARAARGRG
jgi:hypothetical protein